MTNMNELVSTTRDITISGKTLKVRQLMLKELIAHFESEVIDNKIAEAKKVADAIGGEDKTTFMMDVLNDLPKGDDLSDLAADLLSSIKGVAYAIYTASKDLNDGITYDLIKSLIRMKNVDEYREHFIWITGLSDFQDLDGATEGDKKK